MFDLLLLVGWGFDGKARPGGGGAGGDGCGVLLYRGEDAAGEAGGFWEALAGSG